MIEEIIIRELGSEDISIAQKFLFKMVKELFDSSPNDLYHNDIFNLEKFYINKPRNTMIGAFDNDNNIIGTIAIKPYIDRFESLKGRYNDKTTTELARCYIDENFRRKGLGSALNDRLIRFCKDNGYEIIYLHTHRHLPGGLHFWLKKGFHITTEDKGEQETVHMEKYIK